MSENDLHHEPGDVTGGHAKPPLETAYMGFGQVITVGRHLDGERAAWEPVAVRKQHLRGLDRVETPTSSHGCLVDR